MTRALQHADFADDADFLSDLTGKKQKTKSPITVVSGLVVWLFGGLDSRTSRNGSCCPYNRITGKP